MHFTAKSHATGLILTSYFAAVYTLFGTNFLLDRRCNVFINRTQIMNDNQLKYDEDKKTFQTCYNNTLRNTDRKRNLTTFEQINCRFRCAQLTEGFATADGSISPKISQIVKEKYEEYTNATTAYINKIVNIFTGCANEATNKIERLQANSTEIPECEINFYYEVCCMRGINSQIRSLRNATTEERNQRCADAKIGISVP